MKKILVVSVICVLAYLLVVHFITDATDDLVEEQKERLEKYAELILKEQESDTDEPGGTFPDSVKPEDTSVVCDNKYMTEDNILVLHNCTVEDSKEKLCYYKDKAYKCSDKAYKKLYSKLDKDTLKVIK